MNWHPVLLCMHIVWIYPDVFASCCIPSVRSSAYYYYCYILTGASAHAHSPLFIGVLARVCVPATSP